MAASGTVASACIVLRTGQVGCETAAVLAALEATICLTEAGFSVTDLTFSIKE